MSRDVRSPMETVTAFFDAMTTVDLDAALKLIGEDCEYINGPMGTFTGPAGVRAALEPFFAPILENEWIIHRKAVNGPAVFVERLDRHRLASGWIELPVTGVFEVRDGVITVWHDYFDVATIQRQLAPAS